MGCMNVVRACELLHMMETDIHADEVTRHFHKQALRWHPDKHAVDGRKFATEQFQLVQEARQCLLEECEKQQKEKEKQKEKENKQKDVLTTVSPLIQLTCVILRHWLHSSTAETKTETEIIAETKTNVTFRPSLRDLLQGNVCCIQTSPNEHTFVPSWHRTFDTDLFHVECCPALPSSVVLHDDNQLTICWKQTFDAVLVQQWMRSGCMLLQLKQNDGDYVVPLEIDAQHVTLSTQPQWLPVKNADTIGIPAIQTHNPFQTNVRMPIHCLFTWTT